MMRKSRITVSRMWQWQIPTVKGGFSSLKIQCYIRLLKTQITDFEYEQQKNKCKNLLFHKRKKLLLNEEQF